MCGREGHVGQDIGLRLVEQAGEPRQLDRSRSATLRHWALAASASSCAKAALMKAETTLRPLLPAWAMTLRIKWTRQRCQVQLMTLETAALMPSWASEATSLTPRSPRWASARR